MPRLVIGIGVNLNGKAATSLRLSCIVGSVVVEALGSVNALPRLKSCSQTVNEIPSVFVIDTNGIIRAKEVEGKALDLVVVGLLKEHKPGESLQR